jgi:hypothetical protein
MNRQGWCKKVSSINVLVEYIKGSDMFAAHGLFVLTLSINSAGVSGRGNFF